MKKYEAEKMINGVYIVIEKKTCKPVSAKTYSTKKAAQAVADRLNKKNTHKTK